MRRGFTLVEVLVVTAIISVLTALLFPVFAAARAKAHQAVCLSNQHQIGLAMQMYVQDHDDIFPPMQYRVVPEDPESGRDWRMGIHHYIRSGNIRGHRGVFKCPSAENPTSYSCHWRICADDWTVNVGKSAEDRSPYVRHPVALAEIDDLAGKILIVEHGDINWRPLPGDRMDPDYGGFHVDWPWWQNNFNLQFDCDERQRPGEKRCGTNIRYRHANAAVTSFGDGHAKAYPKGSINWETRIYVPGLMYHP